MPLFALCHGRGLLCLYDITSYTGWNFHFPDRATEVEHVVSQRPDKEQLLLLLFGFVYVKLSMFSSYRFPSLVSFSGF